MKFLLVNTNNAVRKIFNITAKKAAIQLDVVSAISQIPLKEDYNCIFIDDGVLNTGDISNFRNKMMMTKFCIILSKDSPLVGGFDSYIRKPFLPTDIYEVMKKEKNSDLNIPQKNAQAPVINANSDIDLNEFSDSEDEFLSGPKDVIDFEMTPDLSVSEKGVDSAEIALDSADLAGGAESSEIEDEKEINFTLDNSDLDSAIAPDSVKFGADSADFALDSAKSPKQEISVKGDIAPNSAPKKADVLEEAEAQINNIKALADKGENFYNSSNDTHNIDFSAVMALQDEILQEEENKKKKSLIGGDIYTKKEPKAPNSADSAPKVAQKVAPKPNPATNANATSASANDLANANDLASANDLVNEGEADFLETLDALNADKSKTADSAGLNDDLNFDALDDLRGISDIKSDENPVPHAPKSANEILNNLDINNIDEVAESSAMQDFEGAFSQSINAEIDSISPNFNAKDFSDEIAQGAGKYNMLGLPIDESGEIKDINDLSESELEKLDDEALLLLQERALQEKSTSKKISKKSPETLEKSPKILNKQQIDDINNILETTQGAGESGAENSTGDFNFGGDFNASDFAMKNNEFDSITQEALSEAINEHNTGDFGNDDFAQDLQNLNDFSDDSAMNAFAQDVEPEESELPDFNNFGAQEDEFLAQNFAKDVAPEEFELPDFEPQIAQNLAQSQDFNNFDLPQNIAPKPQATQPKAPITQAPQIKNTQINVGENLDLAEIIKTFPIDKLRDLLSGVQITINITFPTKKQ